MENKKAAIELSMTTIVVVVLSLTMLIMGFVLVRSIMCGAISMTEDINAKSTSQINSLFESTSGEVTCIGAGDPATLVAGREGNFIICSVKADNEADYKFHISVNEGFSTIPKKDILSWLPSTTDVTRRFSPNDREAKKIYSFNIPKTASVGEIGLDIEVSINEGSGWNQVWSQTLSYKVEQAGAIRGFMC
jgi:hypothetical protein